MCPGVSEPPWREANKSELWDRERQIRELVSNGYSARQIIRILDLKVGGRQVSRTWLTDWIARNGMRPAQGLENSRRASGSAKNHDEAQEIVPAPAEQARAPAVAENEAQSDVESDAGCARSESTVRQRGDSKAERYVSDHPANPVLSRFRKEPT